MIRLPTDWPKLVFILVPVFIVTVDAVVLVHERLQPETQKAIRLVKESSSRKENFTVQQYLSTTVYHRKGNGEALTIEGWRAARLPELDASMSVEFSYSDSDGRHIASWEANLKLGKVTPKNEAALDLAWH
ncbi:MAG: hypothetical protein AABN33_08360 [Acidobacteriota bacterium]